MINLLDYKKNYHSQGGEDGIIEILLREANIQQGYFIEFGAWDGMFLSNTARLADLGWGGVLIEAEKDRFHDLLDNFSSRTDIVCVNSLVMPSGECSLASIINRSIYKNKNPTVLSIDIDSDDLSVWKGFGTYRSFLLIIEYNPTIPADVSFINPIGRQVGNSALAIFEYASTINYVLVAQTNTNMIFIARELLPSSISELDFFETQKQCMDRYFFGYDGTLFRQFSINGAVELREEEIYQVPWSYAPLPQPVPYLFRVRSRNSLVIRVLVLFWTILILVITRPISTTSLVLKKYRKIGLYFDGFFSRTSQTEASKPDRNKQK